MSIDYQLSNEKVLSRLKTFAQKGIANAVEGLSGMIGQNFTATEPELQVVNILEIPTLVGGPENEVVGVYLRAEGKMAGQFMLIMPIYKALELVDMLMDEPIGSTTELDGLGKSALAEVGNLTGTFFLNAIVTLTGLETKPTPPAVMFDMVGAVLNVIVATSAEVVDQVVTIMTNLQQGDRKVQVTFWYIPDPKAMNEVMGKISR